MRTTLSLIVAALMINLCACTTYQYVSVDSSQLQKDKENLLSVENDTMRISYSFSGAGGNVTITVFNKTNQPLYLDWTRSAIVRNDQSFTPRRRDVELIPPQTNISDVILNLNDEAGGVPRLIIPDTTHSRRYHYPDGTFVKYREVDYTEAESPLRLKTYLTFLSGPAGSVDMALTHNFYVGENMHTAVLPFGFGLYHDPGHVFYVWYQ